ncbi:hypothetical protein ACFFRR_009686 [Megaselia abdita]
MKFLYVVLILYPFLANGQLFAVSRVLRDKNNIVKSLKKTPDNSMQYFGTSEVHGNHFFNEPNCEELLAMWRFSKRQARSNELTNEIPAYTRSLRYHPTMYKPFFFGRIKNALVTDEHNKTRNSDPKTRMINGNIVENEFMKGKLIGRNSEILENPSSFDRLKALMFSERVRNLAELQQRQQDILRAVDLRDMSMGSRFQKI